jgi:hypothetical protein
MEVDCQCHSLATLPREGDPVPIVQEVGWALWLLGWVWKILPPTGFDPQTIQPVTNYTAYIIPANSDNTTNANIKYEKLE